MVSVASLSGGRSSGYMAIHYPADHNVFALVEIEDSQCSPKDKKLIQLVSDKIGHQFIATAEDDLTLTVMFELEQIIGREIKWVTGVSYDHLLTKRGVFGGGATGPGRLPSWARRYCTTELKLLPIFHYVHNFIFQSSEDKVKMHIGYRYDEAIRKQHFSNEFTVPVQCRLYGEKRQIKKIFTWRDGYFPMIDDRITQFDVGKFFRTKYPYIRFPKQSNCIGCFHKDELSINMQWKENLHKMAWFARQELLGKGTWRDNGVTYADIKNWNFTETFDFALGGSCDSGGCTD